VRRLGPDELRELEPYVTGVAALHSPTTAIVDYRAVARAMAADIEALGGRVRLGEAVTSVSRRGDGAVVGTTAGEYPADQVVLCAGLQSDTLAVTAGDDPSPAIVPFRGEYFRLVAERTDLVRGLVYPVPDPAYPFLGVHFTPRIDGTVDIGPNAVLATAREGYRRRDVDLGEVWRTLRWPGSRTLFRQHWRAGVREMHGSVSKRAYVKTARAYLPALRNADVVRAPAGARPSGRPRRLVGRRLPDQPARSGDRGAQRAVAGCHVVARDRRAHRRRDRLPTSRVTEPSAPEGASVLPSDGYFARSGLDTPHAWEQGDGTELR